MLEFCPKCQNLMRHQSKHGLKMQCHVCLHLEPINTLTIYTDDYRPIVTDQYPVHAELCEDNTLARTLKMTCPNKDCPSNQPNNKLKPEVVLFHYNSDYTQGYICCACKSYWKQGLQEPTVEIESSIQTQKDLAEEIKAETQQLTAPVNIPATVQAGQATSSETTLVQTQTQTQTQAPTQTQTLAQSPTQTQTPTQSQIPTQTQTLSQTQTTYSTNPVENSESMPETSAMATGVMTELGQEAMKAKTELTATKDTEASGTAETIEASGTAETIEASGTAEATETLPTKPESNITGISEAPETPVAVTFTKKGETAPPASIPIKSRNILEVTPEAATEPNQPNITSRKLPATRLKTV